MRYEGSIDRERGLSALIEEVLAQTGGDMRKI
jgi:hypothetical protein